MILEVVRKKLQFRSWHRGTKEMDFILGRFADESLKDFSQEALAEYEMILTYPDVDLYDWMMGKKPIPEELLAQLKDERVIKLLKYGSYLSQHCCQKEAPQS